MFLHFFSRLYILSGAFTTAIIALLLLSTTSYAQDTNQACINCHQQQHQLWQTSDHAKAMAKATEQSVLGNFDQAKLEYFSQSVRFFKQQDNFLVEISHQQRRTRYSIQYVFGHFPLQQYLVDIGKGKLQVLPFTWDSRPSDEGGQKWYHIQQQQHITKADRLHWQQPLQNWNGMCADCHSDNLSRNYNSKSDSFNSTWTGISVGCVSCHGNMQQHKGLSGITQTNLADTTSLWLSQQQTPGTDTTEQTASGNKPKPLSKLAATTGQWLIEHGQTIASWHGEKRDNRFMQNCFACHALRTPLTDGFQANKAFLDQFSPEFLLPNLYHADGQIKEEVYVYGSFMQSKMYAAGVNCLDCHDSHSMKVKTQTNGLCLQCHTAAEYNTPKHHLHPNESPGAQCINCHMPQTTYMGVDKRRDHSFVIPRPHLARQYNIPHACSNCHQDKSDSWAANILKQQAKLTDISPGLESYLQLQNNQPMSLQQQLSIVEDQSLDLMKRGTALVMLAYTQQSINAQVLLPFASHKQPLIRLATARAAAIVQPQQRLALLKPLLKDKFKAIRLAAAQALVNMPLAGDALNWLKPAFAELYSAQQLTGWRAEGRMNMANTLFAQGKTEQAIAELQQAIEIDPYFEASYINLADTYRALRNASGTAKTLEQGLQTLPESAMLQYSYALYLGRQKQAPKAIGYFATASELDPNNSQYLYAYALALDGLAKTQQAAALLLHHRARFNGNQQLKQLGLYFAQKLNAPHLYQKFRQY